MTDSIAAIVAARPALSPYVSFTHEAWGELRASTPLPLGEDDLERLRGINEQISLDEVAEIYLPLSRLLSLYVEASQSLFASTDTFLGKPAAKVPFVIGVGGSVAVGKSTTARILQTLLARWASSPRVDLLTTDGFLFPNAVLEQRGLMARKGFPESYDLRTLLQFMIDVKSGAQSVSAPVYSHVVYDIVPGERTVVCQPDIVIVEGLNVLQTGGAKLFVSDFFDFSIYVDADEDDIEAWYVARFLTLCDTVFKQPDSFFWRFSMLSRDEAVATAKGIWREINWRNLKENIEPTRDRATLILEKAGDHSVRKVRLRKI